MYPSPKHIEKYVNRLPDKSKYIEYEFTEYIVPYEVKCSCGSKDFFVFNNEEPRVEIECTKCGNKIIVYDLDLYTCSEKYMEEDLNLYISAEGDDIFNVCVIYEYSDEFSLNDPRFDNNDVTWCQVFVYGVKSRNIYNILDDETA